VTLNTGDFGYLSTLPCAAVHVYISGQVPENESTYSRTGFMPVFKDLNSCTILHFRICWFIFCAQ